LGKRIPLKMAPGLYKAGTVYQSKGRWYDANLIRFIAGTVRPVGGWRRMVSHTSAAIAALTGTPRGAVAWRTDSGGRYLAVGTLEKLYVIAGGILTDITPLAFTAGRENTTIPQQGGLSSRSSKYGEGLYGTGRYGEGSSVGTRNEADNWSLDNFGDYLVGVSTSDRKLYYWDANLANDAVVPANAPATVQAVVVTPERFLFALGANGNRRKVQWPSRETLTEWTPAITNTAGGYELPTEGVILCGYKTRRETLIFTDVDLWTATYVGGDFIYRFDQAGKQCGLLAPRAIASFDTEAMWMGPESFYRYDGYVKAVPCDVHDHVFSDMNKLQAAKIWAVTNSQFGEITWYYPSARSEECDRYVTYNYRENHWTVGELARTAGVDAGALSHQTLITPDGLIYEHEVGNDYEGAEPYLEGGPVELGDGDRTMDVVAIIPDEKRLGDVNVTFFSSLENMEEETQEDTITLDAGYVEARFPARQVRMRLTQARDVSWRVGVMHLEVVPQGAR
jgi:hypothetical protein